MTYKAVALESKIYVVEGSIYDRMEAAISLNRRTLAHFPRHSDAVEIADLLNTHVEASGLIAENERLREALRAARALEAKIDAALKAGKPDK